MYRELQTRLSERIRHVLRELYGIENFCIVIEQPPRVELGEYALPLGFELARKLRQPPRKIAEQIVAALGGLEGFQGFEIAGAGYINARLDRSGAARALIDETELPDPPPCHPAEILVEHTSINPNKAAHIGHLRNAILGDTFVRLLRAGGHSVDVQNYIDNTGVQVADVVAGLLFMERRSKEEILRMAEADARFDYTCWDVYPRVSQWYEQSSENAARRAEVLHAIEAGGNDIAEIAAAVSTSVVRFHLRTMQRLGIEYDFLPRESEIIHLHFWELAFQQLKEKGVVYKETAGPKAGCWVARRPRPLGAAAAGVGEEEDTKVIVRSNGTVVYEGKDIAYHLWKFGLLGRDFGYRRFYHYPDGRTCWMSAEESEAGHPRFGGAHEIYNVIDARQAEAQHTVVEALRGLGHAAAADRYHHFSYEMVALTPRCATELGYPLTSDDMARAYIEVSGRKGFGVKADDLIDLMIGSAQKEVDARHAELAAEERRSIAEQIAIGALRYFMLKFTRNSVIAFDFKEALAFEGETGPYVQYAVVRAGNIFRKAGISPVEALDPAADFQRWFSGETGAEIWELWLAAGKTTYVVEQCISSQEPAYLAKHAFQLAQLFSNFYHRHHILNEADDERRRFLLATASVAHRELIRTLGVLGISAPPVM
ncbi:MAG: arginine--tRNA ligase [Acidobacteria bacterium]|nr:arginine--tRNA ligase [Acidobacteriota bacterium]